MKNLILFVMYCLFFVGMIFMGCSNSAQPKDAKEDGSMFSDGDDASDDDVREVEAYRASAKLAIEKNEQMIKEYNARADFENEQQKEAYMMKVMELESRNQRMKTKILEFKLDTKDRWSQFKKEFSHDMNNLSLAFKDIGVNNVR
jgi:hypothetical protein